jgi:hypothetical protein
MGVDAMSSDDRVLSDRRRALEEAFFRKQNEKLKAKMRAEKERAEARRELQAAFEFQDQALLDHLIDQGLDVEAVAALGLVPAVMVAWANGRVGDAEREVVLRTAAADGIAPGSKPYALLSGWLVEQPSSTLIELWSRYVGVICQDLPPPEVARIRDRVMGLARHVAEATGGFLGLGSKISAKEDAMLKRLEQAFRC